MASTLRAKATTTAAKTNGRSDDATRAWACITALVRNGEVIDQWSAVARRFGLTLASMKALVTLTPGQELPMRALAGELHCDASNVTQLVDALEGHGFVERVPKPTDRRVKLLRLTDRGVTARDDVLTELHEPPEFLRALPRREQAELARLLTKVVTAADVPLQPLF